MQTRLAGGEYLRVGHQGDSQTANARRFFVDVIQEVVPEFFAELQTAVYPKYVVCARRAKRDKRGAGHWEPGWYFSTWEAQLGRTRFKPLLLAWANKFGAARETWMLEGALESMSAWYRVPGVSPGDLRRFCRPIAGKVLVDYEGLSFEDPGWNPQFETLASFRRRLHKRFSQELERYERRIRVLIESQGGRRAQRTFSADNCRWLALYQMRGKSLVEIEDLRGSDKGDESTVSKGIKAAVDLLDWKELRGRR